MQHYELRIANSEKLIGLTGPDASTFEHSIADFRDFIIPADQRISQLRLLRPPDLKAQVMNIQESRKEFVESLIVTLNKQLSEQGGVLMSSFIESNVKPHVKYFAKN